MYLARMAGLILSASLYLLAIYGFVWAGKRRIGWHRKKELCSGRSHGSQEPQGFGCATVSE